MTTGSRRVRSFVRKRLSTSRPSTLGSFKSSRIMVGITLRSRPAYVRAYLLVGGGHPIWEEAIELLVNPRQSEMEQMIEPRFTPTHTHPFEALLNQPLTGTFH